MRLRTRAQIVLLAGEQRLTAPAIARSVREDEQTVRRWLKRWLAEGIAGLQDRPTYSPWLNPIEMLWRHFRHDVTHCACCERVKALLAAAADFFARYNQEPQHTVSIIGSKPAIIV